MDQRRELTEVSTRTEVDRFNRTIYVDLRHPSSLLITHTLKEDEYWLKKRKEPQILIRGFDVSYLVILSCIMKATIKIVTLGGRWVSP